jgi:hypothetical protein
MNRINQNQNPLCYDTLAHGIANRSILLARMRAQIRPVTSNFNFLILIIILFEIEDRTQNQKELSQNDDDR